VVELCTLFGLSAEEWEGLSPENQAERQKEGARRGKNLRAAAARKEEEEGPRLRLRDREYKRRKRAANLGLTAPGGTGGKPGPLRFAFERAEHTSG
jgi:hypothetical protein